MKCDSVEKQPSYKFFNMTAYRFLAFKNVPATTPI